jgi:hypothetical protein
MDLAGLTGHKRRDRGRPVGPVPVCYATHARTFDWRCMATDVSGTLIVGNLPK